MGVVLAALPGAASAATISGTAFEDFNDNGNRNASPMVDSGVGGITVTAYNAKGKGKAVATTTTAADGSYTLQVPDKAGEVRVEFTNLPAGYQPDRHGTNSGTTVQFVKGSAANVDVGTLQPGNFCQNNPKLAVACMRYGGHTGDSAGLASIRIVPDDTADQTSPSPGGDPPVPGEVAGALFSQTGAIFGVAQPTASDYLYSSAFTKRHADWGPGGPGAIYRTDIAQANAGTPNASVFFDVNSLPGAPAGNATRGTGGWINDADAWDAVGNTGLGNLTSNQDGSELYTVGLATRELIRIPIPADGSSPASASTHAIPSPCTPAGDARPMGLGFKDGLLYVGGVCSMASVGDPPALNNVGDNRMRVYVYTFDPATGAFSANPVLDTPLQSNRLCVVRAATTNPWPDDTCTTSPTNQPTADWHPWTSQQTNVAGLENGQYPQPMLADIEFAGDDLVLGIRDRSPDQMGSNSEFPDGTLGETGMQSGYTLRACRTGGGYQLEDNGACGGLTTSGDRNIPGWGPGGARFYWPQFFSSASPLGNRGGHDYGGLGGTLSIPGYPELRLASGYAANQCPPGLTTNGCPGPVGPNASAGVMYLDNTDGSRVRGFNLYTADLNPGQGGTTFAKSNGLGDLEALCEAAPIEIGNYVWLDPDRDGIQDPGEKKLSKVKVQLLDASGKKIAQTKTDGQGQYYFNESNVPGAVQPDSGYTVKIPLKQKKLKPYVPTKPDKSEQLRDSDGIKKGKRVVDELATGPAGHNDHTHDFGFYKAKPKLKLDKKANKFRVKPGEVVRYTLIVTNTSKTDARKARVCDNLAEQTSLVSLGGGKLKNGKLCWDLGTVKAGKKKKVSFTARVDRDADPGRMPNVATLKWPGGKDRDKDVIKVGGQGAIEGVSEVTGKR